MEESSLNSLVRKFYPLAFAILPKEEEALNLISDSLNGVLLSSDDFFAYDKDLQEVHFIGKVIENSKKRQVHATAIEYPIFENLKLEEKVILFLRDKMGIDIHQISQLLEYPFQDTLSHLHSARTKIAMELGLNMGDLF